MRRSLLLRAAIGTWLVAACGSPGSSPISGSGNEAGSGSIVPDDDTKPQPDAAAGARDASTRDSSLPPMADAGPYTCPAAQTSRTVGAHQSVGLAITWSGAGYTAVNAEVVHENPRELQITLEKTDASGARVAGPIALTPRDGTNRYHPRISFSGWEYGVTYVEGDIDRRAKFVRVSPSLTQVPGSEVTLDPGAPYGVVDVAVAWSNGVWGVAYSDISGITFRRFDFYGQPLGNPTLVGPGNVSDSGHPLIATETGWALASTGHATLYEIDLQGVITNTVPLGSYVRVSIARDGDEYGLALDDATSGTFLRVKAGGSIIAGQSYGFGPTRVGNAPFTQAPDIIAPAGGGFLLTWFESDFLGPPSTTATLRYAKVTRGGSGPIAGVGFSAQNHAMFPSLAAGPCGWAVGYVSYPLDFGYLDVMP